ncbi:aldolase/citrate lyase family protein [Chryseobacterium sp. A321]
MDSYFFVPGTKLHKIADIEKLGISKIIIDLEDAVKVSEREEILKNIKTDPLYQSFYVRVPLYDETEKLNTSILTNLYSEGFRKFVFPKIQKASDFERIISERDYLNLQVILLIENARFFFEVKDVLIKYEFCFSGIGIGSHDFMAEIGGVHDLKNLEYVRQKILYLARMINIQAIDIASMELRAESLLEEEIKDGIYKGYDAKFFIHPWQIQLFKSISLYSDDELSWALKVETEYGKVANQAEFNPVIIDGQIIERPHLRKAMKIIRYYETK